MTALREQAPGAGPGNAFPSTARPSQTRRPSAARRPVGAAGQARRNLQRDLARREAGLRINRRVSGAAGGLTREPMAPLPEFLDETTTPAQQVAAAPVAPQQRAAAPARPNVAGPQQRAAAPARATPQRAATPQRRPVASAPVAARPTAPQRQPAPQPRPMAQARPAVQRPAAVAQRPHPAAHAPTMAPQPAGAPGPAGRLMASAAAAIAQPGRLALPLRLPKRPAFKALPGGAQDTSTRRFPKLSVPAVIVMAISLVVITIGGVVALQIRMTQVNERMGADLGAISTIQQQNIQLRERLARQTTGAVVNNVAATHKMIEPDVSDVVFRSAGNRAAMARKAADVLKSAPVAPTQVASGAASSADSGTADTSASSPTDTTAATGAATTATGTAATTTAAAATGAAGTQTTTGTVTQ